MYFDYISSYRLESTPVFNPETGINFKCFDELAVQS